jgi:hypothetical protein
MLSYANTRSAALSPVLARPHCVSMLLCVQEDCDMEYFGIDIAAIQQRCKEVGIKHVRFPVRDFDP